MIIGVKVKKKDSKKYLFKACLKCSSKKGCIEKTKCMSEYEI